MKLLLGTTIALLIAALVVAWNGTAQSVADAPPDAIAKMRRQLAEMQVERERLDQEKEMRNLRTLQATPPASAVNAELEAMRAELAEQRQALALVEAEREAAAEERARAAQVVEAPAADLGTAAAENFEKPADVARRARLVSQASLAGRITEVIQNEEVGSFVVLEVTMPEQVQVGSILAVRRQTGILCNLEVTSVNQSEGIANIIPGFGAELPKPGDELIFPVLD